ncbi:MAG: formylglycine-generating enzyme family protein [Gammaproteobacteria bacterium]|nr:formylglycine-generating enzyme family protein [Gammaproteobacteria bacterium]
MMKLKKQIRFSCITLMFLFLEVVFASDMSGIEILQNQWAMKFVKIPAGKFKMGLNDFESALMEVPEAKPGALKDELPEHSVKLSHDFYIGQTEVTQQQWFRIMENKPGPEKFWSHADWKFLPVVSVNWFMVERFVEEINKLDTQFHYRLPSEAEWEYVAKAGSEDLRPVAIEELEDYAWFINNSGDVPHVVASRKPNEFGVYDMLGNVWEWVDDWYAPDTYSKNIRSNPDGPRKGFSKVRRGGSFHCPVHLVRPGYRAANKPDVAYEVTGFRLIAEAK